MSTFSTAAVTSKPTGEMLQAALVTLTNNGFTIAKRDATSASLNGPGLNSTKQNPLLGASSIRLEMRGQQLCLDAELGGVDTMRRFLMRFPLFLGLGLGLLFGVVGGLIFGQQFGVGFGVPWAPGWKWMLVAFGGSMLPVAPWLFLSPMISNLVRNRTESALTALLQNAIQLSRPS